MATCKHCYTPLPEDDMRCCAHAELDRVRAELATLTERYEALDVQSGNIQENRDYWFNEAERLRVEVYDIKKAARELIEGRADTAIPFLRLARLVGAKLPSNEKLEEITE